MSLEIKPTQEAKIAALAATTGRGEEEILEEVIDSYFDDLADVRYLLDRRYDDFKDGRATAITLRDLQADIDRRKREFLLNESWLRVPS